MAPLGTRVALRPGMSTLSRIVIIAMTALACLGGGVAFADACEGSCGHAPGLRLVQVGGAQPDTGACTGRTVSRVGTSKDPAGSVSPCAAVPAAPAVHASPPLRI